MVKDYANFGFDQADLVVAVGYDIVEYAPARWNPLGDKRIIHVHRTVAEVDANYPLEVGLQGSIGEALDAIAEAASMRPRVSEVPPVKELLRAEWEEGAADDVVPARTGADRPRHPRGDGPGRHRPMRHGGGQDVDGAAVSDLRAEHVPALQRPGHDGLRAPRRHRHGARAPRPPGAGGDGRRRVPHERRRDRDGRARTGRADRACVGRRRLRPHRLEAGPPLRAPRRGGLRQPRLRRAGGELRGQRLS